MPLQLRTTTLSTAVCDEGVRCYTKTVDGEVREACNDTSNTTIANSINCKDTASLESREEWYGGSLKFHSSPDSSLCTFASILYQDEEYILREKRCDPRSSCEWVDTDFVQKDCLPATNLAAVHSKDAERVVVFWQDKEGWICYRRAQSWVWDAKPTKLCKAIEGTGIGAASWNDLVDVRVYYQDEYYVIREYRGGFDSTWKPVDGFTLKYSTPVGDITAISWKGQDENVEARLYLQDDSDDIIEWCNSGKGWYHGQFKESALPEADITAFVRDIQSDTPGYLVTVMWTGQDQMLYQRAYSQTLQTWLKPTKIADLQNAGTSVGDWTGSRFSDNCPGIDAKAIRAITVTDDEALNGMAISYNDGTETFWHGGKGGKKHQFGLAEGEDITQVLVSWSKEGVEGLQFITSKGVESPWYGKPSDAPLSWEYKGRALAGFIGTAEERINGLKPFWSSRETALGHLTIDESIALSTQIGKQIAPSATRIGTLQSRTADYSRRVDVDLTEPARAAMTGVAQFVCAVEYLHELVLLGKAVQAEGRPEVAYRAEDVKINVERCQREAKGVESLLKDLATRAGKLVPEGEQLGQEVASEVENSKLRSKRLSDIQATAESLRAMAAVKQRELTAARDKANKDMREAQLAKDAAQERRDTKAAYKFVRDVFTLGIGNRYDVFGLNRNIASIDELIAAHKADLDGAHKRLGATVADIAKVDTELTRIAQLTATTTAHAASLDTAVGTMANLLDQNRDLAHAAAGLAALLSQMHASSEDLDDQSTAERFAEGVLKIGKLADTSAWLAGLMGERGVWFRQTIERIAGKSEAQS